jgi:hypothetical protein
MLKGVDCATALSPGKNGIATTFRPGRTARNTGGKGLRLCNGGPMYPLYRYTPPPSKESDMTSLLSPEITTADSLTERCDRCSAAAKLVVSLTSCGHHANRHREDIVRVAERVTLEEGFDWADK